MTGARGSRTWSTRALAMLVGLASVMALATPAWAPPVKKEFDASISPSSGPGGTLTTLTITIVNLPSTRHTIGSANISVPAGFTGIGTPTIASAPAGTSWTPTLDGNVIGLRSATGSQLDPSESVAVSFQATTPACASDNSYDFGLVVKQSNDFNGVGNDVVTGPSAVTFTVVSCAHHLHWGTQPTDGFAGDTLAAVTVAIHDAAHGVVTSSTAPVTIALANNPGSATLYGTLTVNAVNGVATFSSLVLDKAGTGYTFAASSPGLTGATSDGFDITGEAFPCTGSCIGWLGNIEDPARRHLAASIIVTSTGCSGVCFLSVAEVPSGPGDCLDQPCTVPNGVRFAPPADTTGNVLIQISCDKRDCSGTGVANFVFYIEDADGNISALEDCPTGPTEADMPCITHRRRTGVGDLLIDVIKDGTDPAIRK